MLFISKEWSNMAAFRGAHNRSKQIKQNKTNKNKVKMKKSFIWTLIDQPNEMEILMEIKIFAQCLRFQSYVRFCLCSPLTVERNRKSLLTASVNHKVRTDSWVQADWTSHPPACQPNAPTTRPKRHSQKDRTRCLCERLSPVLLGYKAVKRFLLVWWYITDQFLTGHANAASALANNDVIPIQWAWHVRIASRSCRTLVCQFAHIC